MNRPTHTEEEQDNIAIAFATLYIANALGYPLSEEGYDFVSETFGQLVAPYETYYKSFRKENLDDPFFYG